MPGEGRTPSTKNARISEAQPPSARTSTPGTGQHVQTFSGSGKSEERGAKISRDDDRESKRGSAPSKSTDQDRRTFTQQKSTDLSQRAPLAAPSVSMPAFQMLKDSGAKTARERSFDSEMMARRKALESPNSDRQFYPDALEDEKNEFTKGDGYSGTKAAFRAKKAQ